MTFDAVTGVAFLLAAAMSGGCRQAPAPHTPASSPRTARMDSAEVERLCASPDLVRAGRADCVLKNQARPVEPRPVP